MAEEEEFRAKLAEMGEAKVRTTIAGRAFGRRHWAIATEWLAEQELARMSSQDAIAKASYVEARRSTLAAERAGRWAMWSVIVALVALAVALLK